MSFVWVGYSYVNIVDHIIIIILLLLSLLQKIDGW